MSEKLIVEQILENNRALHLISGSVKERIMHAMEEYAAQQVQQITEERDKAISLALSYRRGGITDPEKDFEAMEFLTSIE